MFHRLELINRNHNGFGTLELLIAIAIAGVIGAASTMSLFQIIDGTSRSNNRMIALSDLRNADYWISRDLRSAQIVVVSDYASEAGAFMTFTWFPYESTDNYTARYFFDEVSDGVGKLMRDYSINAVSQQTVTVSRYIHLDNSSVDYSSPPELILNLVASFGDTQVSQESKMITRITQ